jgi:tetratricopeptide (TPR) repeat protein
MKTADSCRMGDTEDFWDRGRESPVEWLRDAVYLGLIYAGVQLLIQNEPRVEFIAPPWLFLISGGLLVVTTIHEVGHTLAAWLLGFRFRAINIGPLTIVKDDFGHRHVRFEWRRLLNNGGYGAAVPVSEKHIRSTEMMVVFAGPFASLNASLMCWFVSLKAPGTPMQDYWGLPAVLAILFAADFATNLLPIGYSDGSMLWHLLLWTKHGQDLYASLLASKTHEDAIRCLATQDFAGEVQLRQKALDQMLTRNVPPSVQLGHAYQTLAVAQLNHWQLNEAAESLQESLAVFGRCRGGDPVGEANSWNGLATIHRMRHNPEETLRAQDSAMDSFERARAGNLDRMSQAGVAAEIAQLHASAGRYEEGILEARRALALLPDGAKYLFLRATFLRFRMRCEAGLGNAEQATETTLEATRILRSPEIPTPDRPRAASELGNLGLAVWSAGGCNPAELVRHSIEALEKHGGSSRAVGLRIALAAVLRSEGRVGDAETALPPEADIEPKHRKIFLEERAAIYLETGRVREGLAESRAALELADDNPAELGPAQANLAEFLLADGNIAEAKAFARRACNQLLPIRHPGAADALVTLALIGPNESAGPMIEEAIELIRKAPLLERGSKDRALDGITRRLQSNAEQ